MASHTRDLQYPTSMTAAPHLIQVYASLPQTVAVGADLDLDLTNWHWVHCLTLPLETLNTLQFSPKPYKWICYAVGVVVGAEGLLYTSSDVPNAVDEGTSLPAASANLYYHTSNEEKRRMFPVDPHIARTCITSSVYTSWKKEFRDEVAEREGNLCALTGYVEGACDAAHLLSHSKGDQYISTYTRRRSRDPAGDDLIHDIDSVRNGLFLNRIARAYLGKDLAFLMTPNFVMNTADIDPAASPTEKRYTSHFFRPLTDKGVPKHPISAGAQLRISAMSEFPPAILFDAVYAGVVLRHFGTQTLKDDIAAVWRDADHMTMDNSRAAAIEKKESRNQERDACHEARDTPDTFDMLMALPYVMVPRDKLQAVLKEAEEKAEAAEQKRVQEKVDAWARQVT